MKSFFTKAYRKAFILPLTLVILTIVLVVSSGISGLLFKQIYFSNLTRESSMAYYAADIGVICALYIEDAYVDPATGIGIFQYDNTVTPDLVVTSINAKRFERGITKSLTLDDIKCGTSQIFSPSVADFSVTNFTYVNPSDNSITEAGKASTYLMTMNVGNGMNRCAQVTVQKTLSFRRIISRGYTTCDLTSKDLLERAIINTTELR